MIVDKHPIIFNTPKKLIDGSSWITHTPFAFFLVSMLRPKTIVELGVFSGQSYTAFCQAVKTLSLQTRCYGVDTWEGDDHIGSYDDSVYDELSKYNQREYSEFSSLMRMTFNEALSHFKNGSIDLLHIDGCHTYEDARNDFQLWLPKMSARGVMIFHDTFIRDLDFGVWKLWEEISGKYPSFEFYHGCGLGVLAVGRMVNREFIRFIREANKNAFYRKLFNSLGQQAFLKAREEALVKLEKDIEDFKNATFGSPDWRIGSMIHKAADFILPHDSLRRTAAVRLARMGIGASRSLVNVFSKKKAAVVSFPYDHREYYQDTIQSLESMRLPLKNSVKKKCAIFVMVKNEDVFLPIWLQYYSRYFSGDDIYIFDHRSIDGSVQKCLESYSFNVTRLEYPFSFDHVWFKFVADTVQKKLLDHYEYVIFTDIDEIILPDISKYQGLDDYIRKLDKDYVRCIGYELIHLPEKEQAYDQSKPVLSQRKYWYTTHWYNKTLISSQPLDWGIGFHEVPKSESNYDRDLMLVHLHKLDFDICWKTSFDRARLKWPQEDIINNRGWQNRFIDIDEFSVYYRGWPEGLKIEEIPGHLRKSRIF